MSVTTDLAVFATLGALCGWAHFSLLWKSVAALVTGAGAGRLIAAGVARGCVTIATIAFAASMGTIPVYAALGGILAARAIFIRNAEAWVP